MPERIEKRGREKNSVFNFSSASVHNFYNGFIRVQKERETITLSAVFIHRFHTISRGARNAHESCCLAFVWEWERKFNIHDVKRRMKLLIDLIRMMLDHLSTPAAREIGRRTCEWEFLSFFPSIPSR